VHVAPWFLFQAVQSKPAGLVLNCGVESLGFVWILKRAESASTSWLWDRHLMKFFAFDRNATQTRECFAGHGVHGKGLAALLSIPYFGASTWLGSLFLTP
jgi:hypothetical protein